MGLPLGAIVSKNSRHWLYSKEKVPGAAVSKGVYGNKIQEYKRDPSQLISFQNLQL